MQGIAFDEENASSTPRDLLLPDPKHRTAEIHADDVGLIGQLQGQIARAAAEVEDECS